MTKAKTATSPATTGTGPETGASAPETKVKCPRGKAATNNAISVSVSTEPTPSEPPTPAPKPLRQTKSALLRARLVEPGGVSLAALMETTGWQAHTLRAALSGLRKAGVTLTRRREGADTIYAIVPGGSKVAGQADDSAPDVPPDAPVEAHSGMAGTTPDGIDCDAEPTSASRTAESNA